MTDALRLAATTLETFVLGVVAATGAAREAAASVARHLVLSNLYGHDSHGVGMLPAYIRAARAGKLDPRASPRRVVENGAFLIVDGCRGYGQPNAEYAVAAALDVVRKSGICVLGLRNSFHIGRVGAYGEQVAREGFGSLHFVNVIGHAPLVAPFGGGDARFSTNPICIALPEAKGRPPFILDFATSVVALGKCRVAMNKGERLAPGTVIDHRGEATDDPSVMFVPPLGAIRAFGLHKGYGLALAAELLAGAFTGGGTVVPERQHDDSIINNMFAILFDPGRLGETTAIVAEMEAMIDYVKQSPPAGEDQVLVAGEPERLRRKTRERDGIPIDARTFAELQDAARSVGAPALSPP